jgi:DNA modification methylase
MTMPPDLAEYLRTMISPEDRVENCIFLHVTDPSQYNWAQHEDGTVHGIVIESDTVDPVWMPAVYKIMRPGAHLLLAAPDEERLGDTGACRAENAGFEVRDCILWVDEAGDGDHLHYVAKAASREREAGLTHLPDRAFAASGGAQGALAASESESDAEYGVEEDIGLNKITMRKNTHPTCKPKLVMERLLADVPKDQGPVLDPFLGSGTTMIACLATGHNGIGIEREKEYMPICDGRVRHWNKDASGWPVAKIVSDYDPDATPTEAADDDLDFDFVGG